MNRSTVQFRPAAPFYKGLRGEGNTVYQLIVSKDPHYCAKTRETSSLKKETAFPKEGGLSTHLINNLIKLLLIKFRFLANE